MSTPKLSVIVPTRERSDTLFYTLKTLVDQNYSDCEIIVSDNHSKDNTKEVVDAFLDTRIRYINTGRRVSMSENWEFALRHAKGDFITYIGDDDGFVPGAFAGAMALLEKSQMNALVWEKIDYCWPDHIEEGLRNWFSFKSSGHVLHVIKAFEKLREVMEFKDGYTKLPCLYNGIIKKSLLDGIKARTANNVFFNAISPDVFSGIALSTVINEYLYTDYPFSVNGASRHSNGTSFTRHAQDVSDSPKAKFMAENNVEYDSRLKIGPSPIICVLGEYLLVKKFLPDCALPEPVWGHYVNTLIKSAKQSLLSSEILQSARHTSAHIGLNIKVPETIKREGALQSPSLGFNGNSFSFIVPTDMVENIYDACRLITGMLPDIPSTQVYLPSNKFVRKLKNRIRALLR